MLRLVIIDDLGQMVKVPFIRDTISIGRKEGNTIRLSERNISRHHAVLTKEDDQIYIDDLDSFNGVILNGNRITRKTALYPDDLVEVGDYKIWLKQDADERKAKLEMDAVLAELERRERAAIAADEFDADLPDAALDDDEGALPRWTGEMPPGAPPPTPPAETPMLSVEAAVTAHIERVSAEPAPIVGLKNSLSLHSRPTEILPAWQESAAFSASAEKGSPTAEDAARKEAVPLDKVSAIAEPAKPFEALPSVPKAPMAAETDADVELQTDEPPLTERPKIVEKEKEESLPQISQAAPEAVVERKPPAPAKEIAAEEPPASDEWDEPLPTQRRGLWLGIGIVAVAVIGLFVAWPGSEPSEPEDAARIVEPVAPSPAPAEPAPPVVAEPVQAAPTLPPAPAPEPVDEAAAREALARSTAAKQTAIEQEAQRARGEENRIRGELVSTAMSEAEGFMARQRWQEARRTLNSLIEAIGPDPAAVALRDKAQAEQEYKQSYQSGARALAASNYLMALTQLGTVPESSYYYPEAQKKFITTQKKLVKANLAKGWKAYQQNHLSEAVDFAEKTLGLDAGNADALKLKSSAENKLASAPPVSKKQAQPELSAEEHYRLGTANYRTKRFDQAILHFQEAVRLDGNYAYAFRGLGVCYAQLNEYDKAMLAYRRYVSINPNASDADDVRRIIADYEKQKR
ncbi:MAG: FHA domain-containing protein [Myxococcales bacterium]|nr:MAG: FHA domain-containing protein [Myxococcales bacterium]